MAVYQRGSKWYSDVYVKDKLSGKLKRVRVSLNATTKTEAKLEATKLKVSEAPAKKSGGYTLGEAIADAWKSQKWSNKKDKDGTRRHTDELERMLGSNTLLSALTKEVLEDLRDRWTERGNSPATVRNKMAALLFVLRRAARAGKLAGVPAPELVARGNGRLVYLTEEQVTQLVAAEPDFECQLLWTFLFDVGCRIGEAMALKWSDFDWKDRFVVIGSETDNLGRAETKNGAVRAVPLTDAALSAAKAMRDAGRPSLCGWRGYAGWRQRFREACVRIGYELPKGTALHIGRHSAGTNLLSAGLDVREVKEWLGHKAIATTLIYTHVKPMRLRAAADRISKKHTN